MNACVQVSCLSDVVLALYSSATLQQRRLEVLLLCRELHAKFFLELGSVTSAVLCKPAQEISTGLCLPGMLQYQKFGSRCQYL